MTTLKSRLFATSTLHGRKLRALAVLTVAFGAGLGGIAMAQQADDEPPALVGRVADVDGQVSFHRADQQDWSPAGINEPVTVGDAVYTAPEAQARFEIGSTDIILEGDSEFDVAALDESTGQLRLDTGTIDIRVSQIPTEDGLFIDTPRGTVRLTQPGTYRIEAGSDNDPTRVTAWDGAVSIGDGGSVTVRPGQSLGITGTPDAPQYAFAAAPPSPPPAWRDAPPSSVEAQNYVPPGMTGGEDLAEYGAWQTTPDYGPLWYPSSVSADWAPYRDGHWESIEPWGWTWVDDQPWGFAPFHYGRWAFIGNRWGWAPGEYSRRPVYAPALVAFIGGGPSIGWVPLAPGERYEPSYRAGGRYLDSLNRTSVFRNHPFQPSRGRDGSFANRRFLTAVPQDVMRGGRPVGRAAINVRPDSFANFRADPHAAESIKPDRHGGPGGARPGPVMPPSGRTAIDVRPPLMQQRGNQVFGGQGLGRPSFGAPQAPRPEFHPGDRANDRSNFRPDDRGPRQQAAMPARPPVVPPRVQVQPQPQFQQRPPQQPDREQSFHQRGGDFGPRPQGEPRQEVRNPGFERQQRQAQQPQFQQPQPQQRPEQRQAPEPRQVAQPQQQRPQPQPQQQRPAPQAQPQQRQDHHKGDVQGRDQH